MRTTLTGIAAICSVLMAAESWAAQNPTAPLAVTDITAVIGSDVDARNIVAMVLTNATANHARREFLLASQIRIEWLPVVRGVEFVRLADSEIAAHLSGCGVYWFISRLERADNVVSMWLDQRCGGTARHYVMSLDGKDWRFGRLG